MLAQPPVNYAEYTWVVMQGRWIDVQHTSFVRRQLQGCKPIPPADGRWIGCYPGIMRHHSIFLGEGGLLSYEERPEVLYPTHWQPLPAPPRGKFKRPSYVH
jgi:hypothetical protein